MQTAVTALLAPKAVYLIRTCTVTRYTEQQCFMSCVHISSAIVVRHNQILHLNHSVSVHPVINDPGFLYWRCVSLLHVLLDEGTVIIMVSGLQAGQLRKCGS
jgi:hypothetical protein